MDFQYAVDLDVTTSLEAAPPASDRSSGTDVHEQLLNHAQRWLASTHEDAPEVDWLRHGGEVVLTPSRPRTPAADVRVLRVQRAGDARVRAHRLDLRVPLPGQDADLLTRVTISSDITQPTTATLRVVMGPALGDGRLVPISLAFLRRPGLLRQVVTDTTLRAVSARQVVDGRPVHVRTDAEAAEVVDALRFQHRLPMLLISPVRQAGWSTAHSCASELSGLAQVVVVPSLAARGALSAALVRGYGSAAAGHNADARLRPPRGGARLVWPGAELVAEHPAFNQSEVEGDLVDGHPLPEHLLRTLGSLAVAARGFDSPWAGAERAERAAATAELQQRAATALVRATQAGDVDGQLAALREQVEAARADASLWKQLAEDEERERKSAEARASEAVAKADGLKATLAGRTKALVADSQESIDWSDPPAIVKRQDPTALFAWLSERSSGALVFHANAVRSWKKANYAEPDRMRQTLIWLAQAAVELRDSDESLESGRRVDWFRERNLNFAPHDTSIRRSKRALFLFEGEELDAEPHVKIGDNTNPSLCGRVYLAFAESRLVAYHVGSHDLINYK